MAELLNTPCEVRLRRIDIDKYITPQRQIMASSELGKVIVERKQLLSSIKKPLKQNKDLQKIIENMPIENNRHKAVQEILNSEVTYLKQIELIKEYFMEPIEKHGYLTPEEYEIIFGSINCIYQVNGALVEELKADLMNVSKAFYNMAPFFKHYTEYAYNFKNALNVLQMYYSTSSEFSKFMHNQETRPEVQQKLSALMITPIQRIPRYVLLIKQLLEYTKEDHEEYSILTETYDQLKQVAHHIDAVLEERESTQRMFELMRRINQGKQLVIKPGRRLLKEGNVIRIKENKSKEKIYLVLFNDVLMFCKERKWRTWDNSLTCEKIFEIDQCSVKKKSGYMVGITYMGKELVIYSENGDSLDWLQAISNAISVFYENQKTARVGFARLSVGRESVTQAMNMSGLRKRRLVCDAEDMHKTPIKVPKRASSVGRRSVGRPPKRQKSIGRKSADRQVSSTTNSNVQDSLFPLRNELLIVQNDEANTTLSPFTFSFTRSIRRMTNAVRRMFDAIF